MSKNAKTITSLFKPLPIDEQSVLLNALGQLHYQAKAKRVKELEREVEKLSRVKPIPHFKPPVKTRAKPKPTHHSKRDKKLTWSGRGSMPRWMREEMKALKLKPEAFLVGKK